MSKSSLLLITLLATVGLAVGWFSKTSLSKNRSDLRADAQSEKLTSRQTQNPSSAEGFQRTTTQPLRSQGNLGEYALSGDGRRGYVGPRDITVLQRLSNLHSNDMMGLIEVMGQLSQMNAQELAEAWEVFSLRDPGSGLGSQLLAVQVASRLRAAGIDFEMPGGWAKAEALLPETFAIDDVRQNPDLYREKLLAGEELSSEQREATFRSLAVEDPKGAAKLWVENSSSDQLLTEAANLSFLLLDPEARQPLLDLMTDPSTSDEQQSLLAAALGREWAAQDPDGFEAWLDETGDAKLKENASFVLLNARSDTDPVRAVEFARTLNPGMRADGVLQAVESLANADREAGSAVIEEMTDPIERKAAIQGYGYVMAVDHPEEFATWRESLPPAEQDVANRAAFTFFAKETPDDARDWLERQPEGQVKEQLKVELMSVSANRPTKDRLGLLTDITDPEARRQATGLVLQDIEPTQLEELQAVLDAAYASEPPSN